MLNCFKCGDIDVSSSKKGKGGVFDLNVAITSAITTSAIVRHDLERCFDVVGLNLPDKMMHNRYQMVRLNSKFITS